MRKPKAPTNPEPEWKPDGDPAPPRPHGKRGGQKSLNRSELIAAIAAETGQSQTAVDGVVDALFTVLGKSVGEGTKVSIPGWLAVERTSRAARTGRNPQTGETIQIKASKGVKIRAGAKLKHAGKG